MKVISTNIARPRQVVWQGKSLTTGIYKEPVKEGIYLKKEFVEGDSIADRKHHGGTYKACYLFSCSEYDYWKAHYPQLPWQWGMFGENLSMASLDEEEVFIGNQYRIGDALVEATLPREPCYKLGIRMGDQDIIKKFIHRERPGVYMRVLKEGRVQAGDQARLEKADPRALSISACFRLLYQPSKDPSLLENVLQHPTVPESTKQQLRRFLK